MAGLPWATPPGKSGTGRAWAEWSKQSHAMAMIFHLLQTFSDGEAINPNRESCALAPLDSFEDGAASTARPGPSLGTCSVGGFGGGFSMSVTSRCRISNVFGGMPATCISALKLIAGSTRPDHK